MPLAVAFAVEAEFGDGFAETDGADNVLQGTPLRRVHADAAGGAQRQAVTPAEFARLPQYFPIIPAQQRLDADPSQPGITLPQPGRFLFDGIPRP